jgi:predicted glutamine amidotransferase
MIAFKDKGVKIPRSDYMRNAARRNSDGIGIALLKTGKEKIQIKKDFRNVEHLIFWMKRKVKKSDRLLVHFRKATAGKKDWGNRHPFPLTINKQLIRKPNAYVDEVVAHNGVITSFGNDDKFSDTQEFILYILGRKKIRDNLKDVGIQRLIKNLITSDRLLILNKKGELTLFGDFYIKDEILYSNKNYQEISNYFSNRYEYNKRKWKNFNKKKEVSYSEFFEFCEGCGEKKWVMNVNYKKKYYNLCKDCRRKISKNEMEIDRKECSKCKHKFVTTDLEKEICFPCQIENRTSTKKKNVLEYLRS